MTNIGFHILFVLNFVLLSCKGQVFPPSNQSMIVVLPGTTPKLKWTFTGDPSRANLFWYFTKRGTSKEEDVATKVPSVPVVIHNSSLPRVAIEGTATLVLNRVDESYNGKYRFIVAIAGGSGNAEVDLFIAAQPNPRINCSDPTTVNENTDLACSCRDVAGNPPANLTWFDKDDVLIGNTSYGENILILTNVTKKDSGRYTCKAQSYTLKAEASFELKVRLNFKPNRTDIAFTSNPAFVNQQITVTCDSNGLPKPTYTIIFNENVVSNQNTHVINQVKMTDAGTYKCVAKNKLGSHSDSKNLTVEQGQTTSPNVTPRSSSSTPSATSDKGSVPVSPDDDDDDGPNIGLIVGIVIGVLVLILIIGFVVYCYKSKEKERRNRGNIDPAAGNHYELDEDAGPADNAYDSVGPVGTSSSKSKPAEKKNTLPPVYAAVDKNNRQGNTLYASLDTDAMKPKRESKKEPERTPQTEYASIDFAKRADDNVPKADLV